MGKTVNFWKNIKNFGKKLAAGAAKVFKPVGKIMQNLKPVVDTVTDFIPGVGDTIDKVYDVVENVATKGGKLLEDVGKGKNVVRSIKNNFGQESIKKGSEYVSQKILKGTSTGYKRPYEQPKTTRETPAPQFLETGTQKSRKQPKFLKNVLN